MLRSTVEVGDVLHEGELDSVGETVRIGGDREIETEAETDPASEAERQDGE